MNQSYLIKFLLSGLSLILVLTLSNTLYGQKPNFKFKSLKASDGLINSTVQVIFEDSYGFIWLGTHHGLQRYDGKSFTNFTEESSDSTGLSHNYINDFCEDHNGDIWIATSIGLNRYSRKQDRIFRYRWQGENIKQLEDIFVQRILHDETYPGILWMTSPGSKVIKLDIRTDEATIYKFPGDKWSLVLKKSESPLYSNHLLVGSTELYLFNKESGTFENIHPLEQSDDVNANRFNDLVFDPSNNNIVWGATGDIWGRGTLGGLLKYNLETGEYRFFNWKNRPGQIPDRHILTICFSGPDKLWVGTRNYGVLLYDLKQDRFFNYQYNEFDDGSLVTENAIRDMHLDRSGTLWFGTWGDGVSILSPALQKFTHYKHLPNVKGGLPDNWITGVTEDKDENIWIGTKAGGLCRFDPKNDTFETHFREFTTRDNPIEITYLFYDSRNQLWIGTYADALYRYDPVSGRKIHYPKGNTAQTVSQKRISAINELVPGEVVISTYGGGLNIYTYDTDSFKRYLNDPNDSTSIPDNQIWLPFLGDDGNYYVGGNSSGGLIRFDPQTEIFTEPLVRPDINTFLVSAKNSQGRIFIDALSHGLSEITVGEQVSFRTLLDQDGKPIVGGESIAIDGQDKIWVGTENGLVRYDPETRDLTRYDPDDGLQGFHFYRFAAFAASSGSMYFGGLNGLNRFDPKEIELSNYQPPVVITGFRLFQENLEIGEDSPLKENILLTDKIELNHSENDFSISFSALDFSNPHKIQYKYKLVNHDEDWIEAGNFSAAGYTNMDPGSYVFQVMSTNADGVWNDFTTSVEIIIHPPWWQTTLAYAFYGIIFILGVVAVDRIQRVRLKEKARAQARERELEQAKEIEKAYNELKTTQQQLVHAEKMASLGELTAGIAHEIQNPLNFVNNFSEVNSELIEELTEEIRNGKIDEVLSIIKDIRGNEEKIIHHGKRADAIVKNMLQHSRSGGDEKVSTDINALADEYLRLSYHGLRAKDKSFNADFKTDLDERIPKIKVIPQDIGRVFLNLMNNAFFAVAEKAKQAGNGYKPKVSVSTQLDKDRVNIKIKDNGPGIPSEIKGKIFQPFFTTKSTGEGTGLGLSLSYDIVKAHGGSIDVHSDAETGTAFTISLILK